MKKKPTINTICKLRIANTTVVPFHFLVANASHKTAFAEHTLHYSSKLQTNKKQLEVNRIEEILNQWQLS